MRLPVVFAIVMLASGCGLHGNQASRAAIERQVAALRPSSVRHQAPTSSELAPLLAGQWMKQHVIDKDGNHAFVTSKVLSVEADRAWLEHETESYAGSDAVKMLVSLGDRIDPSSIEVFEYWTKDSEGNVRQLPPLAVAALKPALRGALVSTAISQTPEGQEDVTTPAGVFVQAYRARVEAIAMGRTFVSEVWWHPLVPFSGSVRTVGVDPQGKSELVGFGQSGATSVFP